MRTNASFSVDNEYNSNLTLCHRKCLSNFVQITRHFHVLYRHNKSTLLKEINQRDVIKEKQYHYLNIDEQF